MQPVHVAPPWNSGVDAVRALVENQAHMKADGRTPLFRAAAHGFVDAERELLKP
jgi:hypothetical protein